MLYQVHGGVCAVCCAELRLTLHSTHLNALDIAEPLVSELSNFEFEMAIEKLIRHKSQGTDQIPAKLNKQRVGQFSLRSINV